jgi:hypothetical protein
VKNAGGKIKRRAAKTVAVTMTDIVPQRPVTFALEYLTAWYHKKNILSLRVEKFEAIIEIDGIEYEMSIRKR